MWDSYRYWIDSGKDGQKDPAEVMRHGCRSHPAGQKQPNALGLYDMHGSVWEWCWDGEKADYYKESPTIDPLGPSQAAGRVGRGGSWYDLLRYCRSAGRFRGTPDDRRSDLGFRVARARSGR